MNLSASLAWLPLWGIAGREGRVGFTGSSPLCPELRKAVQQVFACAFKRYGCLSSCPTVPTVLDPGVKFRPIWHRGKELQNAGFLQVS